MKPSALFNHKLMAIIGVVFSLPYLFVKPRELLWGLCWLLVSIFTWRRQIWAVSLLILLAVITFYSDIIVEISTLKDSIYELAADFAADKETILILGVTIFILEALILVYVILTGALIVKKTAWNTR